MADDGTWTIVRLSGRRVAVGRLDARWCVVDRRGARTGATLEEACRSVTRR